MGTGSMVDEKNILVMKMLHYFIIDKKYNPIILQGVDNEIWLENLNEDYKVIRIVSGYIHNDAQFDFDIFKTKRIVKKIKKKTLSFSINSLSFFMDLGENVSKVNDEDLGVKCIKVKVEEDILNNDLIKKVYPDLNKKFTYNEKGFELFSKITSDINEYNKKDSIKIEEIFRSKFPVVTYLLITINILLFLLPLGVNSYYDLLAMFGSNPLAIRSGEYYRLLTAIFLHGGVFHLLFNCYALYVLGPQLESFVGKFKYLFIYLVSGISGSLLSMLFLPDMGLSVGASGAIFGIMGSLCYFGYHYRVYLGNVVKSQLIPLIAVNLILGFIGSGIDNFAHIGGLVMGVLATAAVGVKHKSTKFEMINASIVSIIYISFLIYMCFIYSV